MAKRKSRTITKKEDIELLLNLTRKDLTASRIMELFGDFGNGPKFYPYDIITIPAGRYGRDINPNLEDFTTTVGKLIANKIFIEAKDGILANIGWWDDTLTKKSYGKLFDKIGYLRLEDKISLDEYKYFCISTQAVMPFVSILSNGYTDDMLVISKKINKKKAELMKKYAKEIAAGDVKTVDAIQEELKAYAKELLKDDPSMDMYNSGSMGSFDNNFKNMFIMKGAAKDPDPSKGYNIIMSNYIDGVAPDEYVKFANTLAEGPYSRGKKTEDGGYWEKLFVSAFQHIKLDEEGTDCGTKRYIKMEVNDNNIATIMYNYVIEDDGSLTEITSDNRDKYIGKEVKMRFSSLCESKGCICSKCAGNLWYRLGFKNVGTMTPQIPSTVKNVMMKAFHDSQISLTEMDPWKAFSMDEY